MTRTPRPKRGPHTERLNHEMGTGKSEPPGPPPSGPEDEDPFGWDHLTPKEMREWAQREIRDAARALDLRARELFDLVDAYSAGQITPEKANELRARYDHRWGEALPGVVQGDIGDPPLSDERILAKVDRSNRLPFITPREAHERSRLPSDGKSR